MSAVNIQTKIRKLEPPTEEFLALARRVFRCPSSGSNIYHITNLILEVLKEKNPVIDTKGNIKIVNGIKPMLTAHLDTVHEYYNGFNLYKFEREHLYYHALDDNKKQIGIGGDDKCGILIILYLMKFVDVNVIFFNGEETGGEGSRGMKIEANYLIGVDRWNGKDVINQYYDKTTSKEFDKAIKPYMKQYGFEFNTGLFTDCFNVNRDCSTINVSCGYYQHHSNQEYVDMHEVYNTFLFLREFIKNTNDDFLFYDEGFNYENYCWDCGEKLINGVCPFCSKFY